MPWMYNLKARALAFKAAVSRNPVQALSRAQGFFQGRVAEPPDRDTAEWMRAYATSPRLAPITVKLRRMSQGCRASSTGATPRAH